MGSGSSKEKKPLNSADNRTPKSSSDSRIPPKRDTRGDLESNNKPQINSSFKTNGTTSVTQQNSQTVQKNNSNNRVIYRNSRPNDRKVLGSFESDSEEEDIDAVLAATKNEYNANQLRQQQRLQENNNEVSYPETYAQRLQRQQYKHEPQGLTRQKTIYRNPDEWDVEERSVDNFDVSRFKQANLMNNPPAQNTTHEDIFSPSGYSTIEKKATGPDPDEYYRAPREKKKSLPHYDTSEEALLAEIEKEFEL